jgi:hypothetical protein
LSALIARNKDARGGHVGLSARAVLSLVVLFVLAAAAYLAWAQAA